MFRGIKKILRNKKFSWEKLVIIDFKNILNKQKMASTMEKIYKQRIFR